MGEIRTFLEDVRTRLAAITSGGDAIFHRVWVAPFIDLERLLQIPRWPCAVIVDNGGGLDPFNGRIMTRQFSVTVIDAHPRDHIGETSLLELVDLGDLMMAKSAEMEYDTDIEIYNAGDDDVEAVGVTGGILILMKTYRFTAVYERA